MWVNYHSLSQQAAVPRQFLVKYDQLRRPMVPRLKQAIPKTVVTVYKEDLIPTKESLYRRVVNCLGKCSHRRGASLRRSNLCINVATFLQASNTLLLSLMFLDVLVNTVMLILNYTTLVIDFFDNLDWSTVLTKIETVSFEGDEHESYVQYLSKHKSFLEKLNMLIYILIYVAQLIGFYGALRESESLITVYLTQMGIQITVLIFTVILRPFWAPVCILRVALFVLALKLNLRISDVNVNFAWDFDCSPETEHSRTLPSRIAEETSRKGESVPVQASQMEASIARRRSQTMPSGLNVPPLGPRRVSQSMSPLGGRQRMRHVDGQKGSIDETSVMEVMASISHVHSIPVPATTFDVDSLESCETL